MRRIVIAVIVLVATGLMATQALANSSHFKRGREPSCLVARSAMSKSVSCRSVLAWLAVRAGVPDNNDNGNTLPYDEFGLGANQPSQPQVGSAGPQAGREAAGLPVPASVPDNNDNGSTLPYDEFGLGANQPNQPRIGSAGP
jgi:hypothetical protein